MCDDMMCCMSDATEWLRLEWLTAQRAKAGLRCGECSHTHTRRNSNNEPMYEYRKGHTIHARRAESLLMLLTLEEDWREGGITFERQSNLFKAAHARAAQQAQEDTFSIFTTSTPLRKCLGLRRGL